VAAPKSEIRISKTETIFKIEMTKIEKHFIVGIPLSLFLKLKHWDLGFVSCFGFRVSNLF